MKKTLYFIFTITLSAVFVAMSCYQPVQAVTASDWRAGRIIDDVIFENPNDMSVADIQNFLNERIYGGSCDKYGERTLSSSYWAPDYNGDGRTTNAEYAKYRGYGDNYRFTCLKDYYEVPKTAPGSNLPVNNYGQYHADGSPVIPSGSKSAAQLIFDSAQKYRINPKALLVKLATESAGPLTSDDWPFPRQYNFAMGAHCPDSGPGGSPNCDANYAGFSIQMDEAADLLRWYLDSMTQSWWTHKKPGQVNSILWNVVETGCGAGDVFIESKATAALYTYTPYQPNWAALNNMYGYGDGCSAYGNRNFWRVWNDWFGSTSSQVNLITSLSVSPDALGRLYTGERTATFTVKNNTNQRMDLGQIGVASTSPSGRTDGFAMKSVTLAPQESYTYKDTQNHFTEEGDYSFWIISYAPGCSFCTDRLPNSSVNLVRRIDAFIQHAPQVSQGLQVSQSRVTQNANLDISFKVKNNSSRQVDLGDLGVALVHKDGTNVGMSMVPKVSIPAKSERTITSSRVLPKTGDYTASIVNTKNGSYWENDFPRSLDASIKRQVSVTALLPATLQVSPSLSVDTPRLGEKIDAKFRIKNYSQYAIEDGQIGLSATDPLGRSVGYAMQDLKIPAEGELVYSVPSRQFTTIGIYKASIVQFKNNIWKEYQLKEDPSISSKLTFEVKPNLTLQATPSLSNPNPGVGESVQAVFKLKNYGQSEVTDHPVGLVVIDPDGRNVGYAMQNVVAPAGGEFTYSVPARTFTKPGKYTAWITQTASGNWWQYDKLEGSGVSARFTFVVR